MGITGLLPLLKSIMNPIHIKELEGCCVAVDTYSWLHKGALSCSTDLCKGLPTTKHIDYCMHRVNLLRHYGVKPILVFDGGHLPMKGDQEIKRARSRRENLSRAMEHESNGNKTAAYECYQKAVDISPLIANDLIQVLKQESVSYVVAPYEADAQMTFLAINKQVEAVITEDSDLIAFGCPRIIYKMDKFGQGVEFRNSRIQHNKELNLSGFTQTMLLEMCILSGCDYLQSLPGMGLKKAHGLIKKFSTYDKVIRHLQYNGTAEVPPLYEESFRRAILTFRHQRVYDPVTEDIAYLSEPDFVMDDDSDFIGPSLPQHVAKGIALGDLDPFTKTPIQKELDDASEKVTNGTYQLKKYTPEGGRKRLDLPVQKNLVTNYFCMASLEAKQKFKAPRITPKHPNEVNGTCSPQSSEAQDRNDDEFSNKVTNYSELRPLTTVHNSVCKPCIFLHKNVDSGQENVKTRSGNNNVIVRSAYFMNKPEKTKDDAIINMYNLPSASPEDACIKKEKSVTARSPYFLHKNINQSVESEREETAVDYSVTKHRLGSGTGDGKMTVENRKDRIRNSYFKNISAHVNNEDPESEVLVTGCNVATETCKYDVPGGSLGDNSLECSTRKRKIDQTGDSTEDGNDESPPTSGTCASELEDETKSEQGNFGCNITHLNHYSNIAEKSVESFVQVISSFRYKSSGSRASGLRPPLKDIKNNCLKSSTPDVDLSKFVYVPAKQKGPARGRKSKS